MEDTDLSGGVRIQLAQADALIDRGHSVSIATRGAPLTWRSSRAEWLYVDDFADLDPRSADFFIATFWTTVEPAYRLAPEKAIHLSQGYEASFSFYQEMRDQIESVYRLPIPIMVVTRSLLETLAPVSDDVTWIGQIVDDGFFQSRDPEGDRVRVLLVGAAEIDIKGIDQGYDAVAHARWSGAELELVRVSPWRPSPAEPADAHADEFHVSIPDHEMQKLVRSCSIVLGTSRPEEGFGLPVAEGMASGLAPVLTRIPSYLSFDEKRDFARFVDVGDGVAMGDAIVDLIADAELRAALGRRSRQVAEQFRAHHVSERLERFLYGRLP